MKKVWLSLCCVACLTTAAFGVARLRGLETPASGETFEPPVSQRPDYIELGGLLSVVAEGEALEILPARGRSYVEAERGAEYEVRVRNPYPWRVAVALSVDGLNTIDARRSSSWDASKWVVEPYGTITVTGWQMSRERARRFYFTTERDSYAAKLNRPTDIGVITAVFYRERANSSTITRPYPSGEPRARDENKQKSGEAERSMRAEGSARQSRPGATTAQPAPADDDYAATGIGRSVQHGVRWTHLDLDPRPVSSATIRYEYRDALVRLGVLPRHRTPRPEPLGRRERARGFGEPEFSPEP